MSIERRKVRVSCLPKTWILDIDGTLLPHNGHLTGEEHLLSGVGDLFSAISSKDFVIIVTSRSEEYRKQTERALSINGLRWNALLMGAPHGERIVINDMKPSGLLTAVAVNVKRDEGIDVEFTLDKDL